MSPKKQMQTTVWNKKKQIQNYFESLIFSDFLFLFWKVIY